MAPFEQCLASLIELAETNDAKGLVFVDRIVTTYLSWPDCPKDVPHPCDDLAAAFMNRAPDTELKTHILDRLFRFEDRPET